MNITSTRLYRTEDMIYELLSITGSEDACSLGTVLNTQDRSNVPLPCQLFPNAEAGKPNSEFIAVYPILPIENATYTIGAFDENNMLIESKSINVNFKRSKWKSRLGRRIHSNHCLDFYNHDKTQNETSGCTIGFNLAIPSPTHVILRGNITSPYANETISVKCMNEKLELLSEKLIPMGEVDHLAIADGLTKLRTVFFSIRIPWNQERPYLCFHLPSGKIIASYHFTPESFSSLLDAGNKQIYGDASQDPSYPDWFSKNKASKYDLELQRKAVLPFMPRFSIIVPLYKTPLHFFNEMVESVKAQSYGAWELLLVNASTSDVELTELAEKESKDDSRIKHIRIDSNLGISLNTNVGISHANGDFICFFDHDDVLEPNILFEYAKKINETPEADVLYCDEDKLLPNESYAFPCFKPNFSIDLIRNNNYVCHMLTIKKTALDLLEPNSPEYDGAQDHNLVLQAADHGLNIIHVPGVLYHWRASDNSTALNSNAKPYAMEAGIRAVQAHLDRLGIKANVQALDSVNRPFTYNPIYEIPRCKPLVSVIVPHVSGLENLTHCLDSIVRNSSYDNYEIIVAQTNEMAPDASPMCDELFSSCPVMVKIAKFPGKFSYAELINFGAQNASGDFYILLNEDVEITTHDWIELLLGTIIREEVGVAGGKLLYPDGTIQHAGITVSDNPAYPFRNLPKEGFGFLALADSQRNVSAVSDACMITRRDVFELVGGFDSRYLGEYHDIDYCLKVRQQNMLVTYVPKVSQLSHIPVPECRKLRRNNVLQHNRDLALLKLIWSDVFTSGDPYYTPLLKPQNHEDLHYHLQR